MFTFPGRDSSSQSRDSCNRHQEPPHFKVKGMESVIATVTGYHGTERINLVRLIALAGAVYVGSMKNQCVTHLVCWKFEGRKYELAKKFKIAIVNHRWIEECVRRGKIVSEEPYSFQSGEEVGPLCADIMLWINQAKADSKASTNTKKPVIDIDYEECSSAALRDPVVFDELEEASNSRPAYRHRLKKWSSISSEPPCKRGRLVKRHSTLDGWLLTSKMEKDCKDVKVLFENNGVEDIESGSYKTQDGDAHDAPHSLLEIPDEFSEAACEDLRDTTCYNRLPASPELSCVICWTDFSSIRGVLPCGHRFCFSCIQSWSDHMASRNKSSSCPLCKASFLCITRVDAAATADQKIYSQSIPQSSSKIDLYVLPDETYCPTRNPSRPVCYRCSSREPEDLLVKCNLCAVRYVHSFCLDPLLIPWTCTLCKDLQVVYLHSR